MSFTKSIPIYIGTWSENLRWELYLSASLPPAKLCNAVLCVAILNNDRIVLARTKRGWGMLGGHIEENETIERALVRELYEEGGYTPEHYTPFAYRKIIAKHPEPHQQPGKLYPFPVSYIPFFLATTTKATVQPTGPEVLASQSFSIKELAGLQSGDQKVIELGWEFYKNNQPSYDKSNGTG